MRLLLLNIAIMFAKLFSWAHSHLSSLWMTNVARLMFNGWAQTIEQQTACLQRTTNKQDFLYVVIYNHLDYMQSRFMSPILLFPLKWMWSTYTPMVFQTVFVLWPCSQTDEGEFRVDFYQIKNTSEPVWRLLNPHLYPLGSCFIWVIGRR